MNALDHPFFLRKPTASCTISPAGFRNERSWKTDLLLPDSRPSLDPFSASPKTSHLMSAVHEMKPDNRITERRQAREKGTNVTSMRVRGPIDASLFAVGWDWRLAIREAMFCVGAFETRAWWWLADSSWAKIIPEGHKRGSIGHETSQNLIPRSTKLKRA
jgi:hypothetical protein